MSVSFAINSIAINNNPDINLRQGGVLVIVGPNNSGKSAMLRGIKSQLYGNNQGGTEVVRALMLSGSGDEKNLRQWADENLVTRNDQGETTYSWYSEPFTMQGDTVQEWRQQFQNQGVRAAWHHFTSGWAAKERGSIPNIAPFFCSLANTDTRLLIASTAQPDDPRVGPHHPMHVLRRDQEVEKCVSEAFRQAFGTDLILRDGGDTGLTIHCGDRSRIDPARIHMDKNGVWNVPLLDRQGDGMRSFAACLMLFFTSPGFVQLIDEPEAFLHPWHARRLARILVTHKRPSTQLIITTHSGDFLRGVLDESPQELQVVRITRDGSGNRVRSLDAGKIRELWDNPVLRYSNALDGLFHRAVVICEQEADCRFYSAMAETVVKEHTDRADEDTMYLACAGKTGIPTVAAALSELGVKTRVIADFDVLDNQVTISKIVEALGGHWDDYERDWKTIKKILDEKSLPLKISEVREQISEILDNETESTLTKQAVKRIREVLKPTSLWKVAKRTGKMTLPSGQPYQTIERLLSNLKQLGLFVVECGELERFDPLIGGDGSRWVVRVLETRDLAQSPELKEARRFVRNLVSSLGESD